MITGEELAPSLCPSTHSPVHTHTLKYNYTHTPKRTETVLTLFNLKVAYIPLSSLFILSMYGHLNSIEYSQIFLLLQGLGREKTLDFLNTILNKTCDF